MHKSNFNTDDYFEAKKVIKILRKHKILKGEEVTASESVNLWNAALEISTGQSIDYEGYEHE